MRYWDSSALIPLLLEEPRSSTLMAAIEEDELVVTSVYAFVEIASALWRRRREGQLTLEGHQAANRLLTEFSQTWVEIPVSQQVIDVAVSALSRHRLRSGDALQLATAIVSAEREIPFVTIDEALKAAARNEGFPVLP